MPMISVIIPVYRAQASLARCVNSVLAQHMQDFEVILVDDGSPDDCPAICDEYAQRDARIRVIHQKNAGVSAARNAGLEQAEGRFVAFMDSDDEMTPAHLSCLLEAAERADADVVVGGYVRIEQGKEKNVVPDREGRFGAEIWESICRNPSIYGYLWNKLFRTELLKRRSLRLCESMYSQEDLDFCLSVLGCAQTVVQISDAGYRYDYALSGRVPPIWDYIANQVKMLKNGRACTSLSQEAVNCVLDRIRLLLYTGLYDAAEHGCFEETAERIRGVDGLMPLLKEGGGRGEQGFVARCFSMEKYNVIRRYLSVRNRIRDIVRRIRGAVKS